MATKEWLGDGSANLFNVAGNWSPSGVPGAGDVAVFNDKASNRDCHFNVTTGSSITIGEIIVESTYGGFVHIETVPVTKGVFLAKAGGIKAGSASSIDFRQGGSGSEYGSHKSFNNRFVMLSNSGSFNNITLNMYGGSVVTKFDDGDHGTVVLKTGSFAPNYVEPTGTTGKTTFTAFTADNGITFQPTGNLVDNDRLKHFDFGSFTYSDDLFNAGAATCEFKATSSGFVLPITGGAGYGQSPSTTPTDFVSYIRKVILNADTAGHKVLIADNNYVSLEELEIGDGVMLLGPTALTAQGADIRLVNAPKIRGSWSFSQISQGVYRSPRHSSGPLPRIQGNLHIQGNLTVSGSSPGGGGTVDVVSNVATNTILGRVTGGSGDSEELTQSQVLTFLGGVEAGADVTDTANVTSAGALMDSEVTNLADVKAFNPADYATAAQGVKADSALQPGSAVAPGDPVSLLANDLNFLAAGDPVSNLVNDAGYLTSDATSTFCIWNDIGADITGISLGTNQLINNWTYTTGNTGLRDAMSSGVFTCTAALAGTYLIISKIQYKSGTLSETNNVNYKLQNLNFHRAGGGTPSGGTLHNFARHMNASFYNGYILETQFILTMANTDTFGVFAKIATSSGSGNFKVASGSNAMTSLTMIKIA